VQLRRFALITLGPTESMPEVLLWRRTVAEALTAVLHREWELAGRTLLAAGVPDAVAQASSASGGAAVGLLTVREAATLAVLCALVGLSRTELAALARGNGAWETMVRMDPGVKQLVEAFLATDFREAMLAWTEHVSPVLSWIVLSGPGTAAAWGRQLQLRVVEAYTRPFSRVSLERLAGETGLSVPAAEDLAADLIASGRIRCRINAATHTLETSEESATAATAAKVLALADRHAAATRSLLLRAACIRNNVIIRRVQPLRSAHHGHGGGGGGGGGGGRRGAAAAAAAVPTVPLDDLGGASLGDDEFLIWSDSDFREMTTAPEAIRRPGSFPARLPSSLF
jgi:hypothetical protein